MGFIVSFIIAYLLGSISSGVIVSKCLKLPDPRGKGSNNPGATNVFRTSGTQAAIFVLIGDVLKGLIAIIIAILFKINGMALGFVGLAAVIGHIFPVFFKFQGGKGVATAAGVLFPVSLLTLVFVLITWGITVFFTRMVSLASIVAACAAPIYLLIGGNYTYFLPFLCIAALLIWKHKDNINRIRAGTEDKVKFKFK